MNRNAVINISLPPFVSTQDYTQCLYFIMKQSFMSNFMTGLETEASILLAVSGHTNDDTKTVSQNPLIRRNVLMF
jgi:hypothetical protein